MKKKNNNINRQVGEQNSLEGKELWVRETHINVGSILNEKRKKEVDKGRGSRNGEKGIGEGDIWAGGSGQCQEGDR